MLELFNFFLYKISTPAESQQQVTTLLIIKKIRENYILNMSTYAIQVYEIKNLILNLSYNIR